MRLLECQGKDLFSSYGIPLPPGQVFTKESLSEKKLEDFSSFTYPVVVKAQVPVGGRGKAGGIETADNSEELAKTVSRLTNTELKGERINSVLVEEKVPYEKELYLAITLDKEQNTPLLMASSGGGVDIEQRASSPGQDLVKKPIDPELGIPQYLKGLSAKRLGVEKETKLAGILDSMYSLFRGKDATLVEINPLAESDGGLIALDSKVILDSSADFKHPKLFQNLREEKRKLLKRSAPGPERLARKYEIDYVPLKGDVGLISDGAGTGMLTLDLISDFGGSPANFCEMGGKADDETVARSMEVVLANEDVSVLLITLIGGLTRMDHMAEGIADYATNNEIKVPLVIRMCGTKEDKGKEILDDAGIDTFDNHPQAVRRAIQLAEER
ncbi:MAG: ATP-grasp domain-containing protein [Candidatus Acetothermia bacterium]